MAAQCMKSSSGPPSHSPRRAASCTRHGLTSRPVNRTCQGVGTGARWVDRGTGAAGPAWLVVREPRGRPAEAIPRTRRPRSRTRRRPRALFWVANHGETAPQVHMLIGGKTHTAQQGQSQARVGCAARSRQGSVEWVSEQRAHSIGLAAAAVLVAPLVRVLSSAISSTMCAASENTAAVTMPARWWER